MTQYITKRVLFKSIEPGDLSKVRGESNKDKKAGGGARDFRVSHKRVEPVVHKMFPDAKIEKRRRKDKKTGVSGPTDVTIRYATLRWREDGEEKEMKIWYEPPTSARPWEGRIAQVPKIPPLNLEKIPPASEGQAVVMFVEDNLGLWAYYVSEASLKSVDDNGNPLWNPAVSKPILKALANKHEGRTVVGWIDLEAGTEDIGEQ